MFRPGLYFALKSPGEVYSNQTWETLYLCTSGCVVAHDITKGPSKNIRRPVEKITQILSPDTDEYRAAPFRAPNCLARGHCKRGSHGREFTILSGSVAHRNMQITHWVQRCCPLLWPTSTARRSAARSGCRCFPLRSFPLAAAAAAPCEESDPQVGWAHLKERGEKKSHQRHSRSHKEKWNSVHVFKTLIPFNVSWYYFFPLFCVFIRLVKRTEKLCE